MPKIDKNERLWTLITKARNGTVSVNKGLTLREAEMAYERVDPWYGVVSTTRQVHESYFKSEDGFCSMASGGSSRHCDGGDIEMREIIGPSGWDGKIDVEYWPKFRTVYTDDRWNILPDEFQTDIEAAQIERMRDEWNKPKDNLSKADARVDARLSAEKPKSAWDRFCGR